MYKLIIDKREYFCEIEVEVTANFQRNVDVTQLMVDLSNENVDVLTYTSEDLSELHTIINNTFKMWSTELSTEVKDTLILAGFLANTHESENLEEKAKLRKRIADLISAVMKLDINSYNKTGSTNFTYKQHLEAKKSGVLPLIDAEQLVSNLTKANESF